MTLNNEDILKALSNMNILELTELTNLIEKNFNISIQNQNISEKNDDNQNIKENSAIATTYKAILVSYGDNKLNVIKTIRTVLDLGLKEAKEFVEKLPATIKENLPKEDAEKIKNLLETSGAKVDIK